MLQIDADKYFWHAQCGFDWLDPIFYTDEDFPLRLISSTSGIEECRSRIRARRVAERGGAAAAAA